MAEEPDDVMSWMQCACREVVGVQPRMCSDQRWSALALACLRTFSIYLQMTCAKCNQHFCYRCGARLAASNPYEHFSKKGGGCYGLLFDGVRHDEWEPIEGFDDL